MNKKVRMQDFVHIGYAVALMLHANLAFPIDGEVLYMEDVTPALSLLEQNIGVAAHGGSLREGDIYIEKKNRHAVRNTLLTWRGRQVPYELDPGFNPEEARFITSAMTDLHTIVGDNCINFRPKMDSDIDYVTIVNDNACYSVVGRKGGAQKLSLAPRCLYKGTVFHELMHTLGFWHEHTRPDRDKYIKILWDNIMSKEQTNFIEMADKDVVMLDRYDYYSVMHYSVYAFTNDDNLTTIQPLDSTVDTSRMGQRVNLTNLDRIKIRKLYHCEKQSCEHPGFLKNGGISRDDLSVGAKITYKCNEGFALIGPSKRICTDSGTWTGDVPVCMDPTKGTYHYCNFDNSSICGWHSNWTWTSFPTPSKHTGPTWDHTWDSSSGSFIYADGEILQEKNILGVTTPVITKGNIDYCMTFTSSMYGEMMGSLNISTIGCGEKTLIQSYQGNQGSHWNRNVLQLRFPCTTSHFQITFEAGKGRSTESDIAIDDVLIADCITIRSFIADQDFNTNGATSDKCNFTSSLCDWEQESHDDFDWTLHRGPTRTFGTGPDCERTDCSNGTYLYIEASGRRDGDVAKLSSHELQGNSSYCFSFYYNMYGADIGNLTVKTVTDSNQTMLWVRNGDQGTGWSKGSVEFSTMMNEKLVIEATRGGGYRGDIAVDDFELRRGKCLKVIDCDFDNDFCIYSNVNTSDTFDWLRHKGTTSTPGTGPSGDHTSGKGLYLYIEASAPRVQGDTARLESTLLPPSPLGYCLKFWYHMHGPDVASLRMITRNECGNETLTWSKSGGQGNMWMSEIVYLHSTAFNTQIILEGEVGSSYRGDIAVDDISIREGSCEF